MQTLARDFLEENEALHALVEPLKLADMDQTTAFKGWTINTVIRHLHIWNMAADFSLKGDGSFETYYTKLSAFLGEGEKLPAFEIDYLNGLKGADLVAAWRKQFGETAARFAVADPAQRVKWAGPDMSV